MLFVKFYEYSKARDTYEIKTGCYEMIYRVGDTSLMMISGKFALKVDINKIISIEPMHQVLPESVVINEDR